MYDFVSQIAPVPYADDFPYQFELREAAKKCGIPIEEVQITIKNGTDKPTPVTKQYGASHKFESGMASLNDYAIHHPPANRWWAWVGKKAESGAYTDTRVSGLRVRVRNIQINGTAIVRDIFQDHAKSYVRFQDYFLGEIFIEPSALVPNARRDGFEEDTAWKRIRDEIAVVVEGLGKEAYQVSKQGQLSAEALNKNLRTAKSELTKLRKADFADLDRVIKLSRRVTIFQSRIAKATLGAAMETAAELQAIGSKLADIKQEVLSHIGGAAATFDREKLQLEARDEFLHEILSLLEDALSPSCFAAVQEALTEEYGEE